MKSNIMLISLILIPTCLVELRERLHSTLPGGPAKLQCVNGRFNTHINIDLALFKTLSAICLGMFNLKCPDLTSSSYMSTLYVHLSCVYD